MSLYFPTVAERGNHTIFPGVTIATGAGEKLMLSLVNMEPHSVVAEHAHPHEQCGLMLQGRAQFYIGDEAKILSAGEMYFIPGNVKHRVLALDEPVQVIDVFTPVRHEYR